MGFYRCVDCDNFVKTSEDVTEGECTEKEGYITRNALKRLYCSDYTPKQ